MEPRPTGRLPLLAILLVSGAAALGVEVVWARMLHRLLGSTSVSVAAVVAGFLGGLGLGAFVASRTLHRIASPLRGYAGAEAAACAATVLFSLLLDRGADRFAAPGSEIALLGLTVLFSAPWGFSFPVILLAFPRGAGLARDVRWAYGVNAIGSALGGLGVGLVGIPWIGEWGSLAGCVALEGIAAGGAVLLSLRSAKAGAPIGGDELGRVAELPEREPPGAFAAGGGRVAAFLFLSGLTVIYWEVLWTRLLVLTVGSTVYSFSIITGSVVLGIGIGSLAAAGRWLRIHAGWFLPGVTALALAAGFLLVPRLPEAYLAGVRGLAAPPLVAGALGAAAIVLLPNVLLGSLFPWAVGPRVRAVGGCYAVSSMGSLLGAFLGGPLAAAGWGLEEAYRVGIALLAALAVLGLPERSREPSSPGRRRRAALAVGVASVAVGLAVLGALHGGPWGRDWNPKRLLSGVYQWSAADLRGATLEEVEASREIIALVEGREVIVTVERDAAANTLTVRGNGKVEGGVPLDPERPSLADLPTQVLLGAYPAWLLSERKAPSFLVIGLGSGVTVGALVEAHGTLPGARPDGTASVDVIEIERAFLEAIGSDPVRPYLVPFVDERILQGAATAADAGVRFHFGDARRLLRSELRERRWDAILSQPSEPWVPGAASLFTLEFFELAASRLRDGGIFVQWLQLYKLDAESVRLLARTFRRVFPEVGIVRPPGTGEVLLIGSREPIPWERLVTLPPEPWLRVTGLEAPIDRLAAVLVGARGVDSWVGLSPALPVNEDAHSDLAYRAARGLYGSADTARQTLESLREVARTYPIVHALPARYREDPRFRIALAERNRRLGDEPEAEATAP